MANESNFLTGLLQGFNQTTIQLKGQQRQDKIAKLQGQLFELKVKQAQEESSRLDAQRKALQDILNPPSPALGFDRPEVFGQKQAQQSNPLQSKQLLEVLTETAIASDDPLGAFLKIQELQQQQQNQGVFQQGLQLFRGGQLPGEPQPGQPQTAGGQQPGIIRQIQQNPQFGGGQLPSTPPMMPGQQTGLGAVPPILPRARSGTAPFGPFNVPGFSAKSDGTMTITLDQQGPKFQDMGTSIAVLHPLTGQVLSVLPKDTPVNVIDIEDPETGQPMRALEVVPNAAGNVSFGGRSAPLSLDQFNRPVGPTLQQKQEREFVPESELANIVEIDRESQSIEPAPFNLRRGELDNDNFVRVTPAQKKQLDAIQNALAIVEQLRSVSEPVFQAQAGLIERGIQGGKNVWDQILQRNPSLTLYSSQSQGLLSPLIRALGEVGTLTDEDRRKAGKLVPRLRNRLGLPDTQEVALKKLIALENLFRAQYNRVLGRKVFDISTQVPNELIKDSIDILSESAGQAERGVAGRIGDAITGGMEATRRAIEERFNLEPVQ